MGLSKYSPLMCVFDNNHRLVDMFIHSPNATSFQPDTLDNELVRIFNEYKELEKIAKESKDFNALKLARELRKYSEAIRNNGKKELSAV